MQSILPNISVMRRRKAYYTAKEGYAATQGIWKWNSEFYKKEQLKENSNI